MVKINRPGKVAIILQGRYAGRKVVVVKNYDDGSRDRPYGHALVTGIDRYPRKVTASMGTKKIARRSHIKPFVKVVNYNHLMPTRYSMELDELKGMVTVDAFKDKSQRVAARKEVRKVLEQRYRNGKNKWFFNKLRF